MSNRGRTKFQWKGKLQNENNKSLSKQDYMCNTQKRSHVSMSIHSQEPVLLI